MRCKAREITNLDEVIDILDHTNIIRLAMNNGDFPYIVPINFGYELTSNNQLIFYIHGATIKLLKVQYNPI